MQTPSPANSVAVLRRDGVIIPVASFDGRIWRNRWPRPAVRRDVPITLADVDDGWWANRRPITLWTAHPIRAQAREVRVSRPIKIITQCEMQIGLQTDYATAEPPVPPNLQPFPKDGLATAGSPTLAPLRMLDPTSDEAQSLIRLVASTAVDKEIDARTQATSRWLGARWLHPIPRATRGKTPMTLELVFRADSERPGSVQYYFEGVKRYPPPDAADAREAGGTPCDLLSIVQGWVVFEPGRAPRYTLEVVNTDCHRDGLIYGQPLGVLRLNGRSYWVIQRAAWEYERVEIADVAFATVTVVFKTETGSCRSSL